MKIDGPTYGNPVVLTEPVYADAYTSLLSTLPEYRYKNRIVGFSDDSVYACSNRIAKSGYYEMMCEPIPWSSIRDVGYGRYFSIGSVAFGVGLIVLGVALFFAGWVNKTHTGTAILWMPFLAPIAGLAFIFGSKRLRLVAKCGDRKLYWVASPLFQHETELRDRLNSVPSVNVNQEGG